MGLGPAFALPSVANFLIVNPWRDDLRLYLQSMREHDSDPRCCPRISFFGRASLQLNPMTGKYQCTGENFSHGHMQVLILKHSPKLIAVISNGKDEVENGLERFVKDGEVETLVIQCGPQSLILWQIGSEGSLKVYCVNGNLGLPQGK